MRFLRRLAFAAVAVSLLGCEPEQHVGFIAFSPDGRQIAFTAGNYLCLHSLPDGKPQGQVEGVAEPRFDWAPDGSGLVFTTNRSGSYDVALADAHTRQVTLLTDHLAKDAEPCFVLGGKAAAFVSWREGQSDVYVLTLADKTLTRLTNDRLEERSLSADASGSTLAFLSINEAGEYWLSVVRLPGSERRVDIPLDPSLTAGDDPIGSLRLSRDGTTLAFTTPVGVSLLDVKRAERRLKSSPGEPVLTDVLVRGSNRASEFALAPDGRRIAYTTGGQVHTRGLAFLVAGGRISHPKATDDRAPAWSPDGRLIAIASNRMQVELRDRNGRHVQWVATNPADAAQVALDRGDVGQAIALLEPNKTGIGKGADELLARAYLAAGRTQDALDLYRNLANKEPLGRYYLSQGRFEDALPVFQERKDWKTVGDLQLVLGRYDQAAEAYRSVISERGKEEAALLAAALPRLDGQDRRTLAEAVAADLRGERETFAGLAWEFARSKSGRATGLAARLAFRGADALEEAVKERTTGRSRRRALRAAAAAAHDALTEFPQADLPLRLRAHILIRDVHVALEDQPAVVEANHNLLALLVGERGRIPEDQKGEADALVTETTKALLETCLGLNWPLEADKSLRAVTGWVFKDDEAAARLAGDVAEVYDRHGRHAAATEALVRLVRAYGLHAGRVAPVLWKVLPAALAEARAAGEPLSRLPAWTRDRLLRPLQATPAGRDRDALVDALLALFASTQAERERLYGAWLGRWPAENKPRDVDIDAIEMTAALLLADGCLEEGRLDAAIDYARVLAGLMKRPEEARALAQYKDLRRQFPDLVAQWVAAERKSLLLYLPPEVAALILGLSAAKPEEGPSPPEAEVRREWAAIYKDFLVRVQGDTPAFRVGGQVRGLEDNFLYRASAVVAGHRSEWYLRTLLTEYPESEYAGIAFRQLADRYEARGNYYLACTLGEALLPRLAMSDVPAIKERVARLYDERLKRPDLARPLYRDLADHFPDASEWAEAQLWSARDAAGREAYDEAVGRFKTLIERATKHAAVADGTAQYELAAALRAGGKDDLADTAFVKLITTYRDQAKVKDDAALAAIWVDLGDEARKTIVEEFPDDLRRLFPHLETAQQEKTRRQFPTLVELTTRPAE